MNPTIKFTNESHIYGRYDHQKWKGLQLNNNKGQEGVSGNRRRRVWNISKRTKT